MSTLSSVPTCNRVEILSRKVGAQHGVVQRGEKQSAADLHHIELKAGQELRER